MINHIIIALVPALLAGTPTLQPNPSVQPFNYHSVGKRTIYSMALSNDGKRLVIGGWGGNDFFSLTGGWMLWDVPTGRKLQTALMENSNAHSLALSPDGRLIAAGGNGAELKLFDAITGKVLANLEGHRAGVMQVSFTPDGQQLISIGDDNMVRVWDVATRRPLATFRFTAKDEYLNGWKIYPEREHEKAKITVTFPEIVERTYRFAVSTDGKLLAVTLGTPEVKLLELSTGKVLKTLKLAQIRKALAVAFSPDGKLLGVGGSIEAGFIELWDAQNEKLHSILKKHRHSVLCLAISPNNQTVVSGGVYDGTRVWDVSTGRLKYRLHREREARVEDVAFLPDGRTFVTAHHRSPAQFWDTATGRVVSPITAQPRSKDGGQR